MAQDEQIRRLARRITWLDLHQRRLAFVIAFVLVAPATYFGLCAWLPEQWPRLHTVSVTTVIAFSVWYGVETVFGILLSVWETDYAKLTAPATLPRAKLLRRN